MKENLAQILNLARAEAERISAQGGITVARPADAIDVRRLVREIAVKALRASSCSSLELTIISDHAAKCEASRFLGQHCGDCQEFDLSYKCPAGSSL
jgi:hypothetical protein